MVVHLETVAEDAMAGRKKEDDGERTPVAKTAPLDSPAVAELRGSNGSSKNNESDGKTASTDWKEPGTIFLYLCSAENVCPGSVFLSRIISYVYFVYRST